MKKLHDPQSAPIQEARSRRERRDPSWLDKYPTEVLEAVLEILKEQQRTQL